MVAVVVPLYREYPTEYDLISLNQCFRILKDYPIIVVKPESLNTDNYPFRFSETITFDNRYFDSISSYNELMMSDIFYEKFLSYSYILLHQTDAFVFRDELQDWCAKGYDYIGAPWLRWALYPDVVKKRKEEIKGFFHRFFNLKEPNSDVPSRRQLENRVGNGGLSLRRSEKFYRICKESKRQIQRFLDRDEPEFNEDVFWSIEVNRRRNRLRIPGYKEAVKFSFESQVETAIRLTHGQLPFGCHAWEKNLNFFRPYFEKHGFKI